MPVIEVEQLSKAFSIKRRRPGVAGALAALVAASVETRWAVREVSFSVEAGGAIGYIGPNGLSIFGQIPWYLWGGGAILGHERR